MSYKLVKSILLTLFANFMLTSHALSATIQYTYDNLNRLTQVQYDNGTTITYTYDAAGNRLTRQVTVPANMAISPPLATPQAVSSLPASNIPEGTGPKVKEYLVPDLSPYLSRLNLVRTPVQLEGLRQEILDSIDQSNLSPEDKASYKEQINRQLEGKLEAFASESVPAKMGAEERPAAAPGDAPEAIGNKARPSGSQEPKNPKIRRSQGKITNLSTDQAPEGSKP